MDRLHTFGCSGVGALWCIEVQPAAADDTSCCSEGFVRHPTLASGFGQAVTVDATSPLQDGIAYSCRMKTSAKAARAVSYMSHLSCRLPNTTFLALPKVSEAMQRTQRSIVGKWHDRLAAALSASCLVHRPSSYTIHRPQMVPGLMHRNLLLLAQSPHANRIAAGALCRLAANGTLE